MAQEDLPKLDNFIPTKADMEFCPLCDKKFIIWDPVGKGGSDKALFVCLNCEIKIWVRDPVLGRWRRVESEKCPICSEMQRLFFRSDGYIKMKCSKCGYTVETVDPEKHQALMNDEERRGVRFTPKPIVDPNQKKEI